MFALSSLYHSAQKKNFRNPKTIQTACRQTFKSRPKSAKKRSPSLLTPTTSGITEVWPWRTNGTTSSTSQAKQAGKHKISLPVLSEAKLPEKHIQNNMNTPNQPCTNTTPTATSNTNNTDETPRRTKPLPPEPITRRPTHRDHHGLHSPNMKIPHGLQNFAFRSDGLQ